MTSPKRTMSTAINWAVGMAVLILIAGISLWTPGCGGDASSPAVRLTARTGPEAEGLKEVAAAYERETGEKVEIHEVGRDVYMTTMPTQLMAGSADFDIVFLPSTMVAEFAAAGKLAALDKHVVADDDLLVRYTYQDKLYALPTDVSTLFLYYRSDLVPTPPDDWESYVATARELTRKHNPQSATLYGTGFAGKGPEEPPKVFYPALWSHGGFIMKDGQCGLDSPEAIAAGEFWQRLVQDEIVSPEITSWAYPEVVDALKSGKIAMAAPMWNAAYADILGSDSPHRQQIKVAPLPGVKGPDGKTRGANFQHGWTVALNSASKNQAAAAKFMEYATGPVGGKIYAQHGGTPARRSILGSKDLQGKRPEFALVLDSLDIAQAEPSLPNYTRIHAEINDAVVAILDRRQPPAEALKKCAAAVRKLQ